MHAAATFGAVTIAVLMRIPLPAIAAISFSMAYYVVRCFPPDTKPWRFNQAGNWLTGIRLILVMSVLAFMPDLSSTAVFLLFLANLLLDPLDGIVARKMGQASYFGAVFDQEVDAAFVLSAGFYYWLACDVGIWILIPGLLRYVFRLAVWCFGADRFVEKRRPLLATFAGVNFILLTAAVILPVSIQLAALALSTSLFVFSFSISFLELYRAMR